MTAESTNERNLVVWGDDLSLGLGEVDEQHRFLVDRINMLWQALLGHREQEAVQGLIEDLHTYTRTHFSAEEVLMRSFDYPKLEQHQRSHRSFEAKIRQAAEDYDAGKPISIDLLRFLNEWLQQHIKVTDRDYARYVDRHKHHGMLRNFGGFFRLLNQMASGEEAETEAPGAHGLEMQRAISLHQEWVARLEAHLAGEPVEMSAMEAAQDDYCLLGNWLLIQGAEGLDELPEFKTLMQDHADFHICAANIVTHREQGDAEEARRLLKRDLRHLSNAIRFDIIQLYAALQQRFSE